MKLHKVFLSIVTICLIAVSITACGRFTPKREDLPVLTAELIDGYKRYSDIPKPQRFYEDIVLELTTDDEYGEIYPYVGGMVSSWIEGDTPLYGFCDGQGRIICDPVFSRVYLIKNSSGKMYAAETSKPGENDWDYTTQTSLITLNGKWADVFDSIISDVKYDYITAKKDDLWGVIDFDGKNILPFSYKHPLVFVNGAAPLISEDMTAYSLINAKGETVSEQIYLDDTFGFGERDDYPEYEYPYRYIMGVDDEYDYEIDENTDEYDYDNNTVKVTKNGKTRVFENAGYITHLHSDRFLIQNYINDTWRIEDLDGTVILPERHGYAWVDGHNNYIFSDERVFDANGKEISNDSYSIINPMNGYFAVKQGSYGGLVDGDFNWVIKVSLLDYIND